MSSSNPSQKSKRGSKRGGHSNRGEERAKRNNGHSQPSTSSTNSDPSSQSQYCIPLSILNPYITCTLCNGYFIDAVTVMDCLHTFCKSCLIKYFDDHNDCPNCHSLIHQSHPTHYVSFDRTLQEIVYKLVPGLQAEEHRRRTKFMEERNRLGLPMKNESDSDDEDKRTKRAKKLKAKQITGAIHRNGGIKNGVCVKADQLNGDDPSPGVEFNGDSKQCCSEADAEQSHHRKDDSVIINLIPADTSSNPIQRQYIKIPVFATINTLKRALACHLRRGDISHYNDYDIFCNDELMGRDYSIMFIQKTRWRDHSPEEPICLVYKIHKEF